MAMTYTPKPDHPRGTARDTRADRRHRLVIAGGRPRSVPVILPAIPLQTLPYKQKYSRCCRVDCKLGYMPVNYSGL